MVVGVEGVPQSGQLHAPAVNHPLHIGIAVRPQRLLVHVLVVEAHVLCDQPHDAQPLLPQASHQVGIVDIGAAECLLIAEDLVPDGHVVGGELPAGEPLPICSSYLGMPAPIPVRHKQSEVEGQGGGVLLGDHLQVAVAPGHHEIMRSTVSEHADFCKADREVVGARVCPSWPILGADHQLPPTQLLLLDLDNLAEVLDPGIDLSQLSLHSLHDPLHRLLLHLSNCRWQEHVVDALSSLQGRVVHPHLCELGRLVLLLHQGAEELVGSTFEDERWPEVAPELPLIAL